MAMGAYSIRELERISGVKAPTIRIWEKRYGVVRPKRTPTNIRYYEDDDLRKLINLSVLNRNGYRISQLAELDENALGKMVLDQCFESDNENDRCQLFTQALMRIDEHDFEKVFGRLEREIGFEETILRYILPFFREIGVLWHAGAIGPAQEHFVTQLVRRKLMGAVEAFPIPEEETPSYLMFLPEGELHDICLLFCYYIARKHGIRVCYLGTSVPVYDLQKVAGQYHYPKLLTAFSEPIGQDDLKEKVDAYLSSFPNSRIFLTGPQVIGDPPAYHDRLHVIESVEAFRQQVLQDKEERKPVG